MNTTGNVSELSWAPEVCTLPTAERSLREAAFDSLFTSAVRGVARPAASRAVFELMPQPAVAARAAELAMRETSCCDFFTFTLTASGGRLTLEVSVTAPHQPVLDAMIERARGDADGQGR
jgi:hypothetical protein